MREPRSQQKRLPRLLPGKLKGFCSGDAGVTAIEFGILALPFFAVIGAILETSIILLASQVLDSAVQDTSRLITTGQAQAANYDAAMFRSRICDRLYGMFNCAQVRIRVEVLPDFSPASSQPVDPATGQWQVAEAFDPGQARQIVMVRAYYKWPTVVRINGFNMSNAADGTRLLGAARIFVNEPFPS